MLADDTACNPRNAAPCQVYAHPDHEQNLLDDTTQIDFKGPDVTVRNFMNTLTGLTASRLPEIVILCGVLIAAISAGEHDAWLPQTKQLASSRGNLLVRVLAFRF